MHLTIWHSLKVKNRYFRKPQVHHTDFAQHHVSVKSIFWPGLLLFWFNRSTDRDSKNSVTILRFYHSTLQHSKEEAVTARPWQHRQQVMAEFQKPFYDIFFSNIISSQPRATKRWPLLRRFRNRSDGELLPITRYDLLEMHTPSEASRSRSTGWSSTF